MLRLKICDRVTSCLAQKASTVASIVLGSRKTVVGSDSFNVFLLAIDGDAMISSWSHALKSRAWPSLDSKMAVDSFFVV
jgi:hypothetical protein